MSEQRVALISGANRGIGQAVAAELASRGWRLSLGMRRPEQPAWADPERVHLQAYDAADPQAQGALAADSRPTGRTRLPTLTLHAIHDPTAFVELEDSYRAIRAAAGTDDRLVQTFSDEREHSYLSDVEYLALFAELLDWIDHGRKPTPRSVAQRCEAQGPGCHFQPGYQPAALETRVPARLP